jgi:hypothetical protein
VSWRRTSQALLPARRPAPPPGRYDLYPTFPLAPGAIGLGFDALAEALMGQRQVVIDGYAGVLWEEFRLRLDAALRTRGLDAAWRPVAEALKPSAELELLAAPFLGGDDPLFGTRFTGALADFFDPAALAALTPDAVFL